MDWYEIVLTIVLSGSFILVLIRLFLNKILTKIDAIIETMEFNARELKIMGAKIDAIHFASEKKMGNGFTGYYSEALDQNLKVLKIELGN